MKHSIVNFVSNQLGIIASSEVQKIDRVEIECTEHLNVWIKELLELTEELECSHPQQTSMVDQVNFLESPIALRKSIQVGERGHTCRS